MWHFSFEQLSFKLRHTPLLIWELPIQRHGCCCENSTVKHGAQHYLRSLRRLSVCDEHRQDRQMRWTRDQHSVAMFILLKMSASVKGQSAKVKWRSARLCLHEGVGNIYKYIYIYSSYHCTISFLWREQPISLLLPPPPHVESDCLVLWCSLATVIVPFSFTVFSMYVCPRLPKIVPDLAEMCYAILLLYFAAGSGFLTLQITKKKWSHLSSMPSIPLARLLA